jgi:hypothetical protein
MTHYVLARTYHKRPSLQHVVESPGTEYTSCGVYIGDWTRVWMDRRISVLLCRRCAKIGGIKL